MRIERLTQQNLARCTGVLRQPFAVIGRLLPEYRDGRCSAQEELFPEPREKVYPDDVACARFLEEEACAGFAALEGETCAGLLLLRRNGGIGRRKQLEQHEHGQTGGSEPFKRMFHTFLLTFYHF